MKVYDHHEDEADLMYDRYKNDISAVWFVATFAAFIALVAIIAGSFFVQPAKSQPAIFTIGPVTEPGGFTTIWRCSGDGGTAEVSLDGTLVSEQSVSAEACGLLLQNSPGETVHSN